MNEYIDFLRELKRNETLYVSPTKLKAWIFDGLCKGNNREPVIQYGGGFYEQDSLELDGITYIRVPSNLAQSKPGGR